MKVINRRYITGWLAILILGVTVGIGCNDPYGDRIDYTKLQQEEAELRMEFFDLVKSDSTWFGTTTVSVDSMDGKGWASFEIEKGSTDSVIVGKVVAFKYTYYYVVRDESGELLQIPRYTNVGTETLATYVVGQVGQQDTEVLAGVDLAIRHMSLYGKSYILMSHSLAKNDYFPVVAEIEIVSIDLD